MTSQPTPEARRIAYFSMEVALDDALPTYSGGLGVLAGDYLGAAADRGLPIVGVTLLYRHGFFEQKIEEGEQVEVPVEWSPAAYLKRLEPTVPLMLEGRRVLVGAWRYELVGEHRDNVPIYFLDTALEENNEDDRAITDRLYPADPRVRLLQEIVLGPGGVAMLESLGHEQIATYHMNEGHAAFLTLSLSRRLAESGTTAEDMASELKRRCVFTTHTPVPAGHDRFPVSLVDSVLGSDRRSTLERLGAFEDGVLNTTLLGMRCSGYVNAVSKRHIDVSRAMFPELEIDGITNGVHAFRWADAPHRRLFDRNVPRWRSDAQLLRACSTIALKEIRDAHLESKRALIAEISGRTGVVFDEATLTIGAARRATAYKRTDLLFSDLARLVRIASGAGGLQVVLAGKAHPQDESGRSLIRRLVEAGTELGAKVPVVFLENYDLELGRLLVAGCDVWLNTPSKPQEASGTSGMKAAMNGVPSLSVLDGWWIEGYEDGVTGWAIGGADDEDPGADELYNVLEAAVVPTYYTDPDRFAAIGRSAIAYNGSYFNTDRMVSEYAVAAYGLRPDFSD